MYTFDSRVRYSEVGEDARITVNAIIDYMQDCTNFQSEDLGVGLEYHKKKQLMWVLNSWQIVIEKYPAMGEEITVGTQAYGFEKMFGYRNFLITDSSGECVAKANSIWVLMDLKKNRPMIVTPEIGDVYGVHDPLEMDYAPRKIALPKDREVQNAFSVQKHHLDTNHHVNNCQYIRMAADHLPEDFKVGQLRAEYKRQAVLDNVIIPEVYMTENKEAVVLNAEDKEPYAVVEFTK